MEQPASADGETPGGNGTGKRRIPRAHKKNDRGETPLHVAAKKGDDSACLRLLNEGILKTRFVYEFSCFRILFSRNRGFGKIG